MRFGIFSVADHYPSPRTLGQLYGELLEQAEAAEQLGFSSFWLAEHHFHEYGAVPAPAVWLAAAAQRTRRIRLGTAVAVLPLHHPLQVAEQYAMVDVLSGGRLNFGIGSGYLQHEFDGFGVPLGEKRERFDEALDIILRAFTGERFSYHGRYHDLREVKLNVTPLQRPHPPIWIGILRNEAAMHVAQKGFPPMLIPYATMGDLSELAQTMAQFRSAWLTTHQLPVPQILPFGLHTHVAQTNEQAVAQARPALDRYVRTRLFARRRTLEALVEKDLVAFGSPEEIIRVARRYEAAGLTEFLALMNFGGLPHAQVLQSMELMARHVLPAFSDSR